MEQIRVALAWLRAHYFWVGTSLCLVVALVGWYLASSTLAGQFTQNQTAIKQQFDSTSQTSQRPYHPNPSVNERQAEEIKKLAESVRALWSELYERQREVVLKWPQQLGPRFIDEVSGLSFGQPIRTELLDIYLNYASTKFEDLPKIIDAQELVDPNASLGGGGETGGFGNAFRGGGGFDGARGPVTGGAEEEDDPNADQDYLVKWLDQAVIREKLVWGQRPSPLRVWVTQEDLWVYETLLRAIAATNEASGADRYSNAAVREIWGFQVGRQAAVQGSSQERIYRPAGADAALAGGEGGFDGGGGGRGGFGGDGFDGGGGGGGFDESDSFGRGGGDGLSGESELAELLGNRYVDAEGNPLPAPAAPDEKVGAEFKRLPIRLALKMDQRWLPRLIVELANAPLQIEVQEVRVNPTGDTGMESAGGRGGGGGASAFSFASPAGGAGGFDGGRGGAGLSSGPVEVLAFDRTPNVPQGGVVIRGFVYIFNPPDETLLSVDGAGGDAAGGEAF